MPDVTGPPTALWKRINENFGAALERPRNERARFVTEACGIDAELRAEVESLLAPWKRQKGFSRVRP